MKQRAKSDPARPAVALWVQPETTLAACRIAVRLHPGSRNNLNASFRKFSQNPVAFSISAPPMQLPDGLYDKLVTERVAQLIASFRDPSCRTLSALPPEEASERVTDALAKQLTLLLDELDGDGVEKAKRQIALVNALLVHLKQHTSAGSVDLLAEPPQILRAVRNSGSAPEVPETGLAIPWLFTAGKGSPSLLT